MRWAYKRITNFSGFIESLDEVEKVREFERSLVTVENSLITLWVDQKNGDRRKAWVRDKGFKGKVLWDTSVKRV